MTQWDSKLPVLDQNQPSTPGNIYLEVLVKQRNAEGSTPLMRKILDVKTYQAGGFHHRKRKRTRANEPGYNTESDSGSILSCENGSRENQDGPRKKGWAFLQSLQAKEKLNIAPTPIELVGMFTDLYVSSIEILHYFVPWKYRFIALAQKEPRIRENILENAKTIVDLNTNNWKFEQIGKHVYDHNITYPEYPCWFACNGNVGTDYYNLCTSTMLYVTFIIQNNVCAPTSYFFSQDVSANINNAFNYIN